MFVMLFLENGLLLVLFLSGDSLLLLVGVLIVQDVMYFLLMIGIFIIVVSFGCWLSYIQGCWFGNMCIVKGWLVQFLVKYYQCVICMFDCYGLLVLFVGCFLVFVCILLLIMVGIFGLFNCWFQFFNWLSGLLWVIVVISFGYVFSMILFVKCYEDQVMIFLMIFFVVLLVVGLLGMLVVVIKKKYCNV